jgi:hypothetical protein
VLKVAARGLKMRAKRPPKKVLKIIERDFRMELKFPVTPAGGDIAGSILFF